MDRNTTNPSLEKLLFDIARFSSRNPAAASLLAVVTAELYIQVLKLEHGGDFMPMLGAHAEHTALSQKVMQAVGINSVSEDMTFLPHGARPQSGAQAFLVRWNEEHSSPEVLLGRKKGGLLSPPEGFMDGALPEIGVAQPQQSDADIGEAAKRELFEETGINMPRAAFIAAATDTWHYNPDGNNMTHQNTPFLVDCGENFPNFDPTGKGGSDNAFEEIGGVIARDVFVPQNKDDNCFVMPQTGGIDGEISPKYTANMNCVLKLWLDQKIHKITSYFDAEAVRYLAGVHDPEPDLLIGPEGCDYIVKMLDAAHRVAQIDYSASAPENS